MTKMPKGNKTSKTALQRFKITSRGRIFHGHASTSHLRSKESANTRSRKDGLVEVAKDFEKTVKRMINAK